MLTEVLSTIAKFLSVSWRAGAALAFFGGATWVLRYYGVSPIGDMPLEWYQGAVVVGLLGAGFVAVQLLVLLGQGIAFLASQAARPVVAMVSRRRDQRAALEAEQRALEAEQRTRETALENLKCASRDDLEALLWMRRHNRQRFKGYPYPRLRILNEGLLLEQLDGTGEGTHWRFPDHIWAGLEDLEYDGPQIVVSRRPGAPPWEETP